MSRNYLRRSAALAAIVACLATASTVAIAHEDRSDGFVYTLSNETNGNRVVRFVRDDRGRLTPSGAFATGGTGSGGGLSNQGALASDGEFLLAVNPGSNDVSVFKFEKHGLRLVDRTSSGGIQPVSVTIDRDVVYVLNAGSDNIAGFILTGGGRLLALPGSERGLSGTGTGPAEIQFTNDGRTLIVTERATNTIDTFSLDHRGVPVSHHLTHSAAPTPFGFAVTRHRLAVVSEAAGGAPNASALSSYRVDRHDGTLDVISPAVGTTQTAACWVVIADNGRFAFTTNTGSGSVSSYLIGPNGQLTLRNAIEGSTGAGSAPTDMALSEDGEFLHVLNAGTHSIVTFKVSSSGDLSSVGETKGLPAAATGLLSP